MKHINVVLVDKTLETLLNKVKVEEPQMYKYLNRAFDDLKENPPLVWQNVHRPF